MIDDAKLAAALLADARMNEEIPVKTHLHETAKLEREAAEAIDRLREENLMLTASRSALATSDTAERDVLRAALDEARAEAVSARAARNETTSRFVELHKALARKEAECAGLRKHFGIAGDVTDLPCARCGGEVIEFSIPNATWNNVIRVNGRERGDEYICYGCWLAALARVFGETT